MEAGFYAIKYGDPLTDRWPRYWSALKAAYHLVAMGGVAIVGIVKIVQAKKKNK